MIRRDGNGPRPWRVRATDATGRKVQQSFRTKREAEDFELKLSTERQAARAGLIPAQPDITFAELVLLWEQNFAPTRWQRQMLKHPLTRWGPTKVRAIQPERIGVWLHGLELAPKTKTHILQVMRQVLGAGVDWGYVARSPARPGAFKAPGQKRLRPIRPFESWDEVEQLAAEMGQYGPLVRFVCATGVRTPSEWLMLRWDQVDRAKRLLIVHGTKTEAAARTVPLSRAALAALDDLPRSIAFPFLVFPWFLASQAAYEAWRTVEWPNALEAAGLEHRNPYEMRHTFATLALQAGAGLDDVSQALGHASVDITLRYDRKWTRPMQDRLRDVLDTIDREDADATYRLSNGRTRR